MDTPVASSRHRLWSAAPLAGALLLIAAAITLALVGRHTGIGATRMDTPDPVHFIDLAFEDRPDGTILVRNVSEAGRDLVLKPGQDGFVRVAVRALARERQTVEVGSEPPFRLGRRADGRLFLRDMATGRILSLDAYGHANEKAFAQLMSLGRTQQ